MSERSSEKAIIYEKKGPIALITLNRPDKINCMNGELYELLLEALEDYSDDKDLRCAVITGAGGNFSSGGDIKWFREMRLAAHEQGKKWHYEFPAFKALDRLRKPTIAAIDGYCLASGFLLATFFCDIRVASTRAKFGHPGVKRGLGNADVYPTPLNWYTGLGNALFLMLTGTYISSEEAMRMGLVSRIYPAEELLSSAEAMAMGIADSSPEHVMAMKELYKRYAESAGGGLYTRLREMIFRPISDGEAYFEGTKAFIEKRAADWAGAGEAPSDASQERK